MEALRKSAFLMAHYFKDIRMALYSAYRNLNKPNHFSVRQSGKVIDHQVTIVLEDCKFHVGESGRIRVIQQRRKNVHSWVNAKKYTPANLEDINFSEYEELYYDPYFTQYYYSAKTGRIVKEAAKVVLANNRCYALLDNKDKNSTLFDIL